MIAINLAGVQAIDNLNILALEREQECYISHVPEWDDNERAYAVHRLDDDVLIGWIPKLETIEKWGKKAVEENNTSKIEMERQRYINCEFIRDNVTTDMFQNHLEVKGKICRVQQDYETGDIISVSAMFDYM